MIGTLMRTGLVGFVRDRVALLMTFALPIAFFSIFAVVFGGMNNGGTQKVALVVADEENSDNSRRFIAALARDASLNVLRSPKDAPGRPYSREQAREMVETGKVSVALVIPASFSRDFGSFWGNEGTAGVELYADKSDPVAPQLTAGLLQRAAMTAAPDLMIENGLSMFEKWAGPMTETQKAAMDRFFPLLRETLAVKPLDDDPSAASAGDSNATSAASAANSGDSPAASSGDAFVGPLRVKVIDVLGKDDKTPAIAFYAAGTAVMFLLFSASAAGGALLEEQESGTLERLLNSRLTMPRLLLGKWALMAMIGAVQVTTMFVWGAIAFGLNLWTPAHLAGFAVMTGVTAAAAAAFGLVLATICRTRAQQQGIATIVILVMSAVGGSMFPRFLMPEAMQKIGLITFNAWALDGYRKVFWFDQPVWSLWPQVLVLAAITAVFLLLARMCARRWETV